VSDRAALVKAILDAPDEDTPRLVFADFIEERNESERAEFIRSQVEAARLPETKQAASKPGRRAAALLKKHGEEWRTAVGLRPKEGVYHRGFLTRVFIFTPDFALRAPALLSREPAEITLDLLHVVKEDDTPVSPEWVDLLANNVNLRAVVKINSHAGGFGAERFTRLMRSPHLVNLREIALFEDVVGFEGVRAIADAPAPFKLERLDLNTAIQDEDATETKVAVEAVKLIATAQRLAALRELSLLFNGLGERSVKALLKSKTLSKTLKLEFDEHEFEVDEFEEELAKRFRFRSDE
jgi:uncharacterized protein (TIGR02996 family)